ncbi:MAG: glycerophosphodiester phosphodiesterase [Rhodospirillales bacterium]|nr:glycerophosphodiester phosphodiesterase [Rhodospirillales bacterium]
MLPTTPRVVGHRGAAGHAPENTLASLKKAAALGARWVEFDTKLTADGVPVLFHDDVLERTTNATGLLADTTLAEVQMLDAGLWFAQEFRGERVPTLDAAIAQLSVLGLGANVEIKPCPGVEKETARTVAEVLRAEWPAHLPAPLVSSFDAGVLATVGNSAPELARALLVLKIPGDWQARLQDLGCMALHAQAKHLTSEQVAAVRGQGYALRTFTVNDRAEAKKLFAWGVDAVISDFPDRMAFEA